jgi:hypothetical protein
MNSGITKGRAYRLTYDLTVNSGSAPHLGHPGNTDYGSGLSAGTGNYVDFVLTTAELYVFNPANEASNYVIDNMSLVRIGAVAEYDGSSAGSKVWGDKSGNDLHGTVGAGTLDATAPTLENTPYDSGTEYEEGTWTPVIAGSTSAGTYTYAEQVGRYTKIGNIVHVVGSFWNIATSSAGSGNIHITGLPYVSENVDSLYTVGTIGMDTINLTGVSPFVTIWNNISYLEIRETVDNGADVSPQVGAITSGASDMYFQISYRCA